MIMAGGTGGHVFPGLAVADTLRARGWNIIWLGSPQGMEAKLVSSHGYAMAPVQFSGLRGKGLAAMLLLPLRLLRAFRQALQALRQHRPNVVLGMGGYVAFPGGMMAAFTGAPLAVHEQNSVAGLTNKVLARVADKVLEGFPGALRGSNKQVIEVGNPVRDSIATLPEPGQRYAARTGPLKVLVVGGSLGARALNEVLPQALALLPADRLPVVHHQAGAVNLQALIQAYARTGAAGEVVAFINNMAAAYADADLVICRAGALTVAELAAAGVASVLVPYPHAVDDHQTANARHLAEAGAALLIQQKDLTPQRLAELLGSLTREQLMGMAAQARALGRPQAARQVADICAEMAR